MVNIIEFRPREELSSPPRADAQTDKLAKGHTAEIVIFPGVRIERRPRNSGDGDLPNGSAKRAKRPAGRNP